MNLWSKAFLVILILILLLIVIGCVTRPPDVVRVQSDPMIIEKGQSLTNGLAACGFCHGSVSSKVNVLAGGREIKDMYGVVLSSNLTPSKTGIGKYDDQTVINAIRGIWPTDPDKRSLSVHRGYEWMSSSDVQSIVSYLRTLTPVKNDVQKRIVGFSARNYTGFFSSVPRVPGLIPDLDSKNKALYGKYLVNHVARCSYCHKLNTDDSLQHIGPSLVGTDSKMMNKWTEEQIKSYFTNSIRPDGTKVDPTLCPTGYYKHATNDEIDKISTYIRALQ